MDQRRPRRENKPRPEATGREDHRSTGKPRPYGKPRPESAGREDHRSTGKPRPYNKPRPEATGREDHRSTGKPRPYSKPRPEATGREDHRSTGKPRPYSKPRPESGPFRKTENKTDLIRLNKYIANAGICSRREADKLILAGVVKVNGKIVTELGMKVSPGDKVQYEEQTINQERNRYILLNKPKGFITTVDDPEKRKTVMSLIEGACKERVYPVGRLDRNTTGLLLFTNDGTITKKLTHPRYGIKKIYHIELDQSLSKADLEKIREGFELEDGFIKVDKIEYIENSKSKKELGLELHSGKNRIVRRIFERLEYKVVKLDRVFYAGLTKKNLPRGHWRHLDEREINLLKMISS